MAIRSKDLAEAFGIGIPTWKRWAKEFLGPGPGKHKRGQARQYTPEDALKIYLGGLLVSDHGLAVHEARRALRTLWPWIKAQGYLKKVTEGRFEHEPSEIKTWDILIQRKKDGKVQLLAKAILDSTSEKRGNRIITHETFFYEPITKWDGNDILGQTALAFDSAIKFFWYVWETKISK